MILPILNNVCLWKLQRFRRNAAINQRIMLRKHMQKTFGHVNFKNIFGLLSGGCVISIIIKMIKVQETNQPTEEGTQESGNELQIGKWNELENLSYISFLLQNREEFYCFNNRKFGKAFRRMAEFVKTRNHLQCRNHHQKMMRTWKSISGVCQAIAQEINIDWSSLPGGGLNMTRHKKKKGENQPDLKEVKVQQVTSPGVQNLKIQHDHSTEASIRNELSRLMEMIRHSAFTLANLSTLSSFLQLNFNQKQ